MHDVISLPASHIYPHGEARPIDRKKVAALAESIASVGLLNPVIVRKAMKIRHGRDAEAWEILAGHHRYEACAVNLKWAEVPCVVREEDDLRAELIMIDENLCRAELSPAQCAYQTSRRKEIYEALHPETVPVTERGGPGRGKTADNLSVVSFATDAASKTGRDERTVRRDAARGEALGETLKDIAGTSLDKGVELDALAKLDPDQRAEVIDKVKRGEIKSARQYEAAGPSGIDRDLKLEAARNMASWLAERSDASQWEWIKSTLYTAGAKAVADAFVNETGAGVPVMDRRFG